MFSRLLGLGRRPKDKDEPETASPEVVITADAVLATEAPSSRPTADITADTPLSEMKLGLDFGTSTTLVAVTIGSQEPRLLPLEGGRPEMPSYLARENGQLVFGQAAINTGLSVHSVKLALRTAKPIRDLDDMRPEDAAFELIREALSRALEQLKREGRLPPAIDRLTLTTNVGCTPAFDLEQRVRLRDVCRRAGLEVRIANLVEEPVAAAFEVAHTGAVQDGATMVIDIGGGTLDVSVLEVLDHGTRFVLHASGGHELGGDKFTELIEARLHGEVAARRGVAPDELTLSPREKSAIWNRAEAAKIALSTQSTVRVALPDQGALEDESAAEVTLTREWFEEASRQLIFRIVAFITDVYKRSRLTLDRRMDEELDRRPGTGDFLGPNGRIHKSVHDLRLEGDGTEHLATIYLVGGASRMPLLHRKLETIFESRLFDVKIVGMEPTEAIVMGLARHQPLDRIELRNPNWAVQAEFANGRTTSDLVEVYQPYAPLMRMGLRATTSNYRACVPVPASCTGGTLSMVFRPMTGRQGERWDAERLPPGVDAVDVVITLFGDVAVWAGTQRLFAERRTPFSRSDGIDWLPKSWQQRWREEIPPYDWREDSH